MYQGNSKTAQENLDEVLTKSCPYCRGKIPIKAVKCMHCGEWVKENNAKFCPHCGIEIPKKAIKCMHCGDWVEESLKELYIENELKKEPDTKLCPFCDSEVHYNALKCKHCGEWIEKQVDLNEITNPAKDAIIGEAVREGIKNLRDIIGR
ncbi:double zinc ribbon domain-containing protein [Methanobacterium oryzae]|uniref:double zinc ribbon domain-containing protein n=1 Tax=Methanobacterium oryzae TaxID=69540 RepID=UPI003D1AB42B